MPISDLSHGEDSTYHEWRDPVLQQLVNESRIEFDTLGVDGVIAASQRDDSRPGDGESVRLYPVVFQKLDVLEPALVRIRRDITVPAVKCLAWCATKVVPDRLSSPSISVEPSI